MRISHKPSRRGSGRLQKVVKISARMSAALSFDVLFENDFEWVLGGKLGAGLWGGKGTTGYRPIEPNGWSARLMWRPNGTVVMYLYHQQRRHKCGDNFMAMDGDEPFRLQKGVWYNLKLSITMNNPPDKRNGRAELFINGISRAVVDGMQWRKVRSAKIDKFALSTFYGGNAPKWAPSRTTHVKYDNFLVQATDVPLPAPKATPAPTPVPLPVPKPTPAPDGDAFCAMGIRNGKVCCGGRCGRCSGSGCSRRPGGYKQCCGGGIKNVCTTARQTGCLIPSTPAPKATPAPTPVPLPVPKPTPAPDGDAF